VVDFACAGSAGQHDDAGAACPEAVGRLALVVAQRPAVLVQRDRVRLAVDVAGHVLGRPAEPDEDLLDLTTLGGVDRDRVVVDAVAHQRLDLGRAQHLFENCPVGGVQGQPVRRVLLEAQPSVAGHRLGEVDEQRVRDGIAGVAQQGVHDLLGVVAGSAGVPEAERCEPVGMDVLGGPLELGERGDGKSALVGLRMLDLEQQGLVALDDQRSADGRGHPPSVA